MADKPLEHQIDRLWFESEDGLYEALGITGKAIAQARKEEDGEKLAAAQQYDARFGVGDTEFSDTQTAMAATDFFRDIGRTWWQKLEPKIYDLLCDTENEDREQFMKSLMEGAKSLALALAPALVAQLETLPSVASILATIAAKRIADAGLEAMCQKWGKSLDKRAEKAGEEGQPEAAEEELAEAGLAGAGGGGPDQAELYDEAGEQLPVGEQRPAGEEEEGPSQVDLYDRGD